MKRALLAFCLICISSLLAAQGGSRIKSDPAYLWAEGSGATTSKADDAALQAIVRQLASTDILPAEPSVRAALWHTYLPDIRKCCGMNVSPSGTVLRYIAWADVPSVFSDRWRKVRELEASARAALDEGRTDEARTYCQWAETYLLSLPPGQDALRRSVSSLRDKAGEGVVSAVRLRNVEAETASISRALGTPQTGRLASARQGSSGSVPGQTGHDDASGRIRRQEGSGKSSGIVPGQTGRSELSGRIRGHAEAGESSVGNPGRDDSSVGNPNQTGRSVPDSIPAIEAKRLSVSPLAAAPAGDERLPEITRLHGEAPVPLESTARTCWKTLALGELGRVPAYGFQLFWRPGRLGGYVSARSHFDFVGTDYTCLADGQTDFGYIWASGRTRSRRTAGSAGAVFQVSSWLDLYAGAGYGSEAVLWEDNSGLWAEVRDYSAAGFLSEAGASACLGRISFSLGISCIRFSRFAALVGAGIAF